MHSTNELFVKQIFNIDCVDEGDVIIIHINLHTMEIVLTGSFPDMFVGCGLQKNWGKRATPSKIISFDPFIFSSLLCENANL